VIGWSVAVPTVAGAALGLWIDHHWPGGVSWTLTLLIAGVILGCLNAWHWVSREGERGADESESGNSGNGEDRKP
jgi:ATP synthase protein I